MTDKVEERVLAIIREKLSRDDITMDSSLDELGVDSLDTIDILFDIEEEFDINIPDHAARSLRTLREVVDGVERLVAGEVIEPPPEEASPSAGAAPTAAPAPAPAPAPVTPPVAADTERANEAC